MADSGFNDSVIAGIADVKQHSQAVLQPNGLHQHRVESSASGMSTLAVILLIMRSCVQGL